MVYNLTMYWEVFWYVSVYTDMDVHWLAVINDQILIDYEEDKTYI